MKSSYSFCKTAENREGGWLCNEKPNKLLGATRVQIADEEVDFTPDIQKASLDTTRKSVKSLSEINKKILDKLGIFEYFNHNNNINADIHQGKRNTIKTNSGMGYLDFT